ncbi:unnamed protein product [Clonostachys rhizophaga]|uniref:Uncharacterized protein n=1 Tax=Clonostachys rhizophaga TaxID=160324 RepID=A0A9N9VE51_9HYPO|nr:unnamed protein product [Clonostachys rhizophaga]
MSFLNVLYLDRLPQVVVDDLEGVVVEGARQRRLALHVLDPDVGAPLDQPADDVSGFGDLGGAVQRRHLLDVLRVDVRAVLEQHVHQLYRAHEADHVKGCRPLDVDDHPGAVLEQVIGDQGGLLGIAVHRQRVLALFAQGVWVGTQRHQQLGHIQLAQGCTPSSVSGVDIGAVSSGEKLDDIAEPSRGGAVQGCLAVGFSVLDSGAVGDELVDRLEEALPVSLDGVVSRAVLVRMRARSNGEGDSTEAVLGVDVGIVLEEEGGDLVASVVGGDVERGVLVAVANVDIDLAGLEQGLDDVEAAGPDGGEDREAALFVPTQLVEASVIVLAGQKAVEYFEVADLGGGGDVM